MNNKLLKIDNEQQIPRETNTIEYNGEPHLIKQVFDRVGKTWNHLGEINPFWSVISSPEYHGKISKDQQDKFFKTGVNEFLKLNESLQKSGLYLAGRKTCLEYGCGLGRMTRQLAPFFEKVIAVDISLPHLQQAESLAKNIKNINWHHLKDIDDLSSLPKVDFIYSMIVLQHNPPPVIECILQKFSEILNPGGVAFFQVPTYRPGYSFNLEKYLASPRRGMEMHIFPQNRIFQIFIDSGSIPVSVVEDGSTGRKLDRSNTFTFVRRD